MLRQSDKAVRDILVLLLLLLGTGPSICAAQDSSEGKDGTVPGSINVTSAVLARQYVDQDARDVTATFAPKDRTIHVVLHLAYMANNLKVRHVWTAVDARRFPKNHTFADLHQQLKGQANIIHVYGTAPWNWPVGKYKVVVYLNDKKACSLPFAVSNSAPPPTPYDPDLEMANRLRQKHRLYMQDALVEAIQAHRFRVLRLLIVQEPSLANVVLNDHEERPLHYVAGAYPDYQTVVFLISKGVSVNIHSSYGLVPVEYALLHNNYQIIDLMLHHGCSVNGRYGQNGGNLLFDTNDPRMFDFLLSRGANINFQNGKGNTLLHEYVEAGNKRMCAFLKSKGANLRIENNAGYTPSELATLRGNSIIADLLRP